MVTATAKFTDTDNIIVEVTLRMTFRDCKDFLKNIEGIEKYPNWQVSQALREAVINKVEDIAVVRKEENGPSLSQSKEKE